MINKFLITDFTVRKMVDSLSGGTGRASELRVTASVSSSQARVKKSYDVFKSITYDKMISVEWQF